MSCERVPARDVRRPRFSRFHDGRPSTVKNNWRIFFLQYVETAGSSVVVSQLTWVKTLSRCETAVADSNRYRSYSAAVSGSIFPASKTMLNRDFSTRAVFSATIVLETYRRTPVSLFSSQKTWQVWIVKFAVGIPRSRRARRQFTGAVGTTDHFRGFCVHWSSPTGLGCFK